jgi:hypothetical protein
MQKRTKSGRVCTNPGCPGFNHCIQKNLISIKKIKFTASKENCKKANVNGEFKKYKNARAAGKAYTQKCHYPGCQYFNACRRFEKVDWSGKNMSGTGKA